MPIYDFRCRECDHRFEELVSHAKKDQVRCPRCGGAAEQQVSAFAVGGGSPGAPPRFT